MVEVSDVTYSIDSAYPSGSRELAIPATKLQTWNQRSHTM